MTCGGGYPSPRLPDRAAGAACPARLHNYSRHTQLNIKKEVSDMINSIKELMRIYTKALKEAYDASVEIEKFGAKFTAKNGEYQ